MLSQQFRGGAVELHTAVPDLQFPDDVILRSTRILFFLLFFLASLQADVVFIPMPVQGRCALPTHHTHFTDTLLAAGKDLPEAVVRPVTPA